MAPRSTKTLLCPNGKIIPTSNSPLRAGKGHLYEGGIRIPLLVRWPGSIAPRSIPGSVVTGIDIIPTLLHLAAGQVVPNIDGKSFKGVLAGDADWSNRPMFWHSNKARPLATGDHPSSAVRNGSYKLVHFYGPGIENWNWGNIGTSEAARRAFGYVELYDLRDDPSEAHDLSAERPVRTRQVPYHEPTLLCILFNGSDRSLPLNI